MFGMMLMMLITANGTNQKSRLYMTLYVSASVRSSYGKGNGIYSSTIYYYYLIPTEKLVSEQCHDLPSENFNDLTIRGHISIILNNSLKTVSLYFHCRCGSEGAPHRHSQEGGEALDGGSGHQEVHLRGEWLYNFTL